MGCRVERPPHVGKWVGRESELAILQVALADARAGHTRFASIGGTGGVGKSRLAARLAEDARAVGVTVHVAGCPPISGAGPLPYAPFTAVARSIIRSVDAQHLPSVQR